MERQTAHNEPAQAWEMIWNELRRAGISRDQAGPIEGTIQWGTNAQIAIQSLQEAKLSVSEVHNIGMLLQAALHASEIYWRPGDLSGIWPRKRLSRKEL